MQKKIYISGKISGLPIDEAKAKFAAHAIRVAQTGHIAVNPFDIAPENGMPWEHYMKKDIAAMVECDEVHLLPCWQESKGAVIERDIALKLNIPVVYCY